MDRTGEWTGDQVAEAAEGAAAGTGGAPAGGSHEDESGRRPADATANDPATDEDFASVDDSPRRPEDVDPFLDKGQGEIASLPSQGVAEAARDSIRMNDDGAAPATGSETIAAHGGGAGPGS